MGPSSAPMRRPLDHRAALGRPYLVASALGAAAAAVARSAPGLEPIDPMRGGSGRFLDRLERLRGLVDDATGRVMPKWVFYDCGEVPGAIVGLTRPARDLDRQTLALLGGVDDPAELVPVSMLIALPMLRPGWWHLYALGAAGPEDADEQRSVTVSLTLAVLAVETATAALPWRSAALDAFARSGAAAARDLLDTGPLRAANGDGPLRRAALGRHGGRRAGVLAGCRR